MRLKPKQSARNNVSVFFAVLVLIALSSCGQKYNSNSGDGGTAATTPVTSTSTSTSTDTTTDKSTATGECGTPAAARTCAAIKILKANCATCHTHRSWANFATDKHWIDDGLIKAGNAGGSELIQRLINAGGDMPRGGSALSNSDYQALQDWANKMTQ